MGGAVQQARVKSRSTGEIFLLFSTQLGVPTVENLGANRHPRLSKGLVKSRRGWGLRAEAKAIRYHDGIIDLSVLPVISTPKAR